MRCKKSESNHRMDAFLLQNSEFVMNCCIKPQTKPVSTTDSHFKLIKVGNTEIIMDKQKEKIECESSPPTSVEDLPLLVLKKIFRLLPDRESAMQVCTRWHHIINFEVGRTVYIGNGRLVYNFPGYKTVTWKPLETLSKVGIEKCLFAETVDSDTGDYGVDNDKALEGFMLPELVKELSFYGKITNELFHVILTPVYWLTTLKIHLTVFRLVSFENYAPRLYSLRHLRILYTHPVFHLSFPFKEDDALAKESIHGNVTKFLSTCYFHRIKIFEFVGPYFVDETKSLIDTVRTFVTRHQISLKELVLSFPYEWNVKEDTGKSQEIEIDNGLPSYPSNDERLGIRQRREGDWGNVQLHRLQVVCPATLVPPAHATTSIRGAVSAWSQKVLNGTWNTLLEKQSLITSLHYINKYADWTFPQAIFVNNAHSLKVISLSINSKYNVDCSALSCCKRLVKLCLEGNYFCEEENGVQDFRDENNNYNPEEIHAPLENDEDINRLFNVHHLPESLQEICLSKLMIPVSEVEALIEAATEPKRFPNLASLQLYQICKGYPQFGLTTVAVQRLFDQSNLSVSFWQALNYTSFEGAISKALNKVIDPDVMTLMKVVEHCDTEDEDENIMRFANIYDYHVQLIRKSEA